jgi:hypothetical protein|tara:strand:- start:48 stop:299 length:252 start_codon:yes stop_codon:yes gene_type:complete
MIITAEECGELTQRCSKIVRKYSTSDQIEEDQRAKLLEEAGDVLCMIELMVENGILTNEQLGDRVNVKRHKLKIWSDLIEVRD